MIYFIVKGNFSLSITFKAPLFILLEAEKSLSIFHFYYLQRFSSCILTSCSGLACKLKRTENKNESCSKAFLYKKQEENFIIALGIAS